MKRIVVIGGGTGTFTVLKGLKQFPELDLTAVVTMTDDGGSTGKLRDEFGLLPVGDVRQCLVALSSEKRAGEVLRALFNYRFPGSDSSLAGHNFGNLFLAALSDILGSEAKAIQAAAKILNVKGQILPVTTDKVDLVAQYDDGDVLIGESQIDDPDQTKHNRLAKIVKLWTQPKAQVYLPTRHAILAADLIVLGPGDLYSSLISNLVVQGMAEAICQSSAKFVYITNLVSKQGQTHELTYRDYLTEIAKYSGRKPDRVIVNSTPLPEAALAKYASEQSYPIVDDLGDDPSVIRADLLAEELIPKVNGDKLKRSLIRHDSHKLATILVKLSN